ncbi:MAG: energy transducer TonB [Gemmatimonadales bacterium]
MRLTLLESDRSFWRSAECAFVSIVAHVGVVWLAVDMTQGGGQMPLDEREARVFFLLPPDRVDAPMRQTEIIQWGKLGADLEDGGRVAPPGDGFGVGGPVRATRPLGRPSGPPGQVPFGPAPFLSDTAFSVLEVDEIVERYDGSAAPIYPRDLIATGTEGQVQTIYVVDTMGRVDTTTIQVVESNDPRFTESVRTALGGMRFRPAKRAGKPVRQLVQQRFRFKIAPPSQTASQAS